VSEPIIAITGANGFIGRGLVYHFHSLGWQVRAFVHSPPMTRIEGVDYVPYALERALEERAFQGAQHLVHCAHLVRDRRKDSEVINLNGTQALIELCRRSQIRLAFLSSFSAHAQARSEYGRVKLRIEGLLDPARDLILRPGLVLGPGGLCGNIVSVISRRGIVPLVGGGQQPLQTVALEDLCKVVSKGLQDRMQGAYYIAHPDPITLRGLIELIGEFCGHRPRMFPVPLGPTFLLSRLAEFMGLKLPVSSDSILGAKHLRVVDTRPDLEAFDVRLQPCREVLAAFVPQLCATNFPPP